MRQQREKENRKRSVLVLCDLRLLTLILSQITPALWSGRWRIGVIRPLRELSIGPDERLLRESLPLGRERLQNESGVGRLYRRRSSHTDTALLPEPLSPCCAELSIHPHSERDVRQVASVRTVSLPDHFLRLHIELIRSNRNLPYRSKLSAETHPGDVTGDIEWDGAIARRLGSRRSLRNRLDAAGVDEAPPSPSPRF